MNWRWLINHIATGLGRLPREVAEEMDWPEAKKLMRYWLEFPPPHVLLRRLAIVQTKFEPKATDDSVAQSNDVGTPEQLLAMFGGGGGTIRAQDMR
jgi:hypothetical protein